MSTAAEGLLVVTPLCNEETNIGATITSMMRQTVRPALWVIVDDGSTDRSLEVVREMVGDADWIRVATRPPKGYVGLDRAEEVHAFDDGLALAGGEAGWDYIGKFDADIELDPDYFERLMAAFAADPRLGIACGSHWMKEEQGYVLQRVLSGFVWGPVKLYRRQCLEAIGGIEHRLGWDTHDVVTARVLGWNTRTLLKPRFYHNKGMGSRGGLLKGKFRYGRTSYFLGYSPLYFLGRLAFQLRQRPVLLGSLAMIAGYFRAMARREEIILTPEEVRELRRIQHRVLKGFLRGEHLTDLGYDAGPDDDRIREMDHARGHVGM